MTPLIQEDGGHVAVAVDDLTTGAHAACGGAEEFVTASIVKVDILATLLYQKQQDGQAFSSEERGLATTTVDDQIRLLHQVFASPSALSPTSRQYIRDLMSRVETDQQWGVPTAADPGTPFMVKNGWLPTSSLWEINSIGEITHDHQHMLIAVLSGDNADEASGIAVVEEVAKKAAQALAG